MFFSLVKKIRCTLLIVCHWSLDEASQCIVLSSPHTQWQSHRASAAEQTCVSTLTLQLIASVPSTQWSHSDLKKKNKTQTNKQNRAVTVGMIILRWEILHDVAWQPRQAAAASPSFLPHKKKKKNLKTHVWGRFTYHDFVWGSKRKRRKRKREEKGVKNRASRVVPNGVDATTAEWEGGALRFIYAGQEDQLLCAEGGKKRGKKTLYYRHLKTLFQTQPTRISSALKYANYNH